ncbi:hypothetical protein MRX96_037612 [Rhipicephalus microplus]
MDGIRPRSGYSRGRVKQYRRKEGGDESERVKSQPLRLHVCAHRPQLGHLESGPRLRAGEIVVARSGIISVVGLPGFHRLQPPLVDVAAEANGFDRIVSFHRFFSPMYFFFILFFMTIFFFPLSNLFPQACLWLRRLREK